MAALIGWLARPLPQRPDQPTSGLLELLETDSTVGASVVPRVPPVADPDHVPLEIRVGLVSQSPITAFQPGPDVLCRNQNGSLIPSQQLGKRIASSTPKEIHCSGGPLQINQHHYRGDVSLLKGQGDWLPVVSLALETYVASVVGAEMPSQWHQKALKAQAVAARSYAMAHLARPATTAYHLGDTTRWQVFAGEKSTTQASRSATPQPRGMILSYSGGIVESLYASNAQVSAEAHGHLGASMSQTGAQHLASQGLPFNAILGRYYAGASLARLTWHDQ
ncbi:SpoIID/LytB domain-containing protein [Synechococcus sp. MU1643]|nr:SpoIID/LytB domain-containing protein [Synechococcus sp. MU1643]MCB4427729.1 SpoIID/LytB domain-containing protein [Synechococcus sp. MU1643]